MQPILVVLVWRGGERFQRALDSIRDAEMYFKRIILSITSAPDSGDMSLARTYLEECARLGNPSKAEIICTGTEFPTMKHQDFWIRFLQETGAQESDWIYWLAYDDQLFVPGIASLVNNAFEWPLEPETAYFGPWAMRHEEPDRLWELDPNGAMEVWTSFPANGPLRLRTTEWIVDQMIKPTYMQMSGSIAPLRNHSALGKGWPKKGGPMRIEMATACYSKYVSEFPTPVSIIYGRRNSDRANYAEVARKEDRDLLLRMIRTGMREPQLLIQNGWRALKHLTKLRYQRIRPVEEWRVRDEIQS